MSENRNSDAWSEYWSHPHLVKIEAAREARQLAELEVRQMVKKARRAGVSWTQIGDVLGTTKQAAQQRYGTDT